MELMDFLNAADGRICGGTEFQWKCYPNGRYIDIANIDGDHIAGCIFSTVTQEVYEVDAHVYEDEIAYRWISPEWDQARIDEADARGVDSINAYDNVRYLTVHEESEILDLVHRIVHKTYVHSQPVAPFLSPATAWPFPVGGEQLEPNTSSRPSYWPYDSAEEAAAELAAEEARFAKPLYPDPPVVEPWMSESEAAKIRGGWHNPHPYTGKESEGKEDMTYEVTLTVKHTFEIEGESMEDAIAKAREFESDMRAPKEWPDDVSWIDRFTIKEGAARRIDD